MIFFFRVNNYVEMWWYIWIREGRFMLENVEMVDFN